MYIIQVYYTYSYIINIVILLQLNILIKLRPAKSIPKRNIITNGNGLILNREIAYTAQHHAATIVCNPDFSNFFYQDKYSMLTY